MPERIFQVRWPDGYTVSYYSPSSTVSDRLSVGASYTVEDFVARTRVAMQIASDRVNRKYGYSCSSALDTLRQIESTAARFGGRLGASVSIVEMYEPGIAAVEATIDAGLAAAENAEPVSGGE
jgi:uncharacterized repeat protein (TIGR04042 family)